MTGYDFSERVAARRIVSRSTCALTCEDVCDALRRIASHFRCKRALSCAFIVRRGCSSHIRRGPIAPESRPF